uniref:Uncharacterized protein n=1 Tax=Candidatus Kentrum eta TaxID=2126337 RepID=A0A450UF91_9GAMM|nr:MAG: hypothetical protein BECKH772A_GA0070896_1001434 [Candidatus Kentron sp. H]VFJ91154.1 MAG: hypothetical protein BECKH772B_GA0070898_1001434 [Candidatus Kentron sp. H]VFJ97492.1 MAG: hypothetical protein BECKH772C_GA0070978_1001334 [Candidatus Kentron sp. H]
MILGSHGYPLREVANRIMRCMQKPSGTPQPDTAGTQKANGTLLVTLLEIPAIKDSLRWDPDNPWAFKIPIIRP